MAMDTFDLTAAVEFAVLPAAEGSCSCGAEIGMAFDRL
jgi:hypothetical protein